MIISIDCLYAAAHLMTWHLLELKLDLADQSFGTNFAQSRAEELC